MRSFPWRQVVRTGFLGAVVALHLSLVGMVEAFSRRELLKGIISMGQMLLVVTVLITAYLAARRLAGRKGEAVLAGVLAGLIIAAVLAVLAVIIKPFNLRAVLANASPGLVKVLTFKKPPAQGIPLLLLSGAILGGVGGLLTVLPRQVSRPLLMAATATLTLGLLRDIFAVLLPRKVSRFLYTSSGLTLKGFWVYLIGWGLFFVVWQLWGARLRASVRASVQGMAPPQRRTLTWVSYLFSLAVLFALPQVLGERGSYVFEIVDIVGIYVVMGLGLNIVVGFAGLLDLGYVAFFAIGAYTMAVLTSPELVRVREVIPQMTFWEALPFALLASLFSGILLGIPVLKTRGDYLAIITLGFGEIIRLLVLSDFLKPFLGGAQGMTGIARPTLGAWRAKDPQDFYYFILIAIVIGYYVSVRLKTSRLGRAWMAIREDEDVAMAMGIDHVATKLTAFATGATLAGLSGAIFAAKLGSMAPHSFNLLISINVLCLLIVGGMGSIPGVVVGAAALVGLPELLREFTEYRLLVYGAALVLMMLFRPEGLWPEEIHVRELHEEEVPVEAMEKGTAGAVAAK